MSFGLDLSLLTGRNVFAANPPPGPTVDGGVLVFHADLLILAFFGLFALLTLPRLITRFSRASEWPRGHFLHSTTIVYNHTAWKRKHNISSPLETLSNRAAYAPSDNSHTLNSHTHLIRRKDEKGRPLDLPPHSISWTGRYHRVSAYLGQDLVPGYSIGRSILVLGYSCIVLYSTIYKSNPFSDAQRAGFVAMAQLPILFALATKNNILGMMWALGYEKLNWLHRAVGAMFIVTADIHALGYIYHWSITGVFQQRIALPSNAFGLVTVIFANLILVFSTPFWRKKAYNVFIVTHVLGIIMVPVGLVFHKRTALPWVLAAAGLYGLDHIIRLFKTRICKVTLRTIPEMGMTRIDVPHLNAGWRAGQHVRIRVMTAGMGILGRIEVHPFTIASVGGPGNGMTLMCKKAGDWTTNLYEIAARGDSAYSGGEGGIGKTARIIIEGPYGGPGHTMFDSFSGAMFVAGGSGITYALSAVQDLVQKDIAGRSRIKVIELIWVVQDANSLAPMLPMFSSLVQQAVFVNLRISVHYTRASMTAMDPNKIFGYLPPNIMITPGRPRFANVLDSVVDRACALFSPSGVEGPISDKLTGVVVSVCGPGGLADSVREAVGGVDPRRYKAVGGIELSEEVFGW